MICKELSNVSLLCADSQSLVRIRLNVFDLPRKRCAEFLAITLTPEIP